ncbi:MAG: DUF4124 domain-containing protein [Desulfuromonadales bacterium]|nr:DUF4124 domain-containing protein [Desulfuromonadales bacterium]
MKKIYILLALLILFPSVAYSNIYQWTDDNGVRNFTDNPDSIPAKYRQKATVQKIEESDTTFQSDNSGTVSDKKETLYGGKTVQAWRDGYQQLRKDLEAKQAEYDALIQEQQATRRQRILFTRISDRERLNDIAKELDSKTEEIKNAKEAIEDYKRSAAQAGLDERLFTN